MEWRPFATEQHLTSYVQEVLGCLSEMPMTLKRLGRACFARFTKCLSLLLDYRNGKFWSNKNTVTGAKRTALNNSVAETAFVWFSYLLLDKRPPTLKYLLYIQNHIQIKISCMPTTYLDFKIYKALIYTEIYIATSRQVFLLIWCPHKPRGTSSVAGFPISTLSTSTPWL